jgi:hypothetical protein
MTLRRGVYSLLEFKYLLNRFRSGFAVDESKMRSLRDYPDPVLQLENLTFKHAQSVCLSEIFLADRVIQAGNPSARLG